MAEFRLVVPEPGVPFEVGQSIFLHSPESESMHDGVITEIVDIGIRIGLVVEVDDDSPLAGLQDEWIESLMES